MLTSNVIEYASIEFITQKKTHNVVLHDMVMFPAVLTFVWPLSRDFDLEQVKIIIFQLATPEYHNLDTVTTKLARIQPYLYGQWPFLIYAD